MTLSNETDTGPERRVDAIKPWMPALLAVAAMIAAGFAHPPAAPLLAAGAAITLLAMAVLRPRRRVVAPPDEPEETVSDRAAVLAGEALEALPDPLLIISGEDAQDVGDRSIIRANRAATALLRLPAGVLDHPLHAVLRDPGLLEAVDEALFGRRSQMIDYQPGGAQERHWSAWVAPLPAHDGLNENLAVLRLRDETDARRAELMRVDFLANASHELRTPLASLSGFIETLRGHAREDPVAREKFLSIMAVQADRMTRLVGDLLSLSRIELNEHIPPSGKVDLAGAVSDVVDATGPLAGRRGILLKVSREGEGSASVTGDRDQLIQVIQNLTDNAIKYSPDDADVEISLRIGVGADEAARVWTPGAAGLSLLTPDRDADARYVLLTVRDHGPGLARETMPRLTERFYRVEGQKSGERLGTGLGLAIVKHIVNRHRGGMTVESVVGQGATFAVYLPLRTPHPPA
ncbi:MAG: two-component system phosphate regulon sensor histidine kinase PhoR [Brevundimonas sp.]|jgi:two-component system phosphate regulon sensor histidine kinase PhoR|uniref:ATP-binding protein n=1 Tax=Brevundimonas sp. TaxID=1871086 RepID=UPI0039E26028